MYEVSKILGLDLILSRRNELVKQMSENEKLWKLRDNFFAQLHQLFAVQLFKKKRS